MTVAVWIVIGHLAMTLITALATRFHFAYVFPDAVVVTAVFLALKRAPIELVLGALALGYLAGRQAMAPVGLHEGALVLTAITVYLAAGNIAGSGKQFFTLACGAGVMLYHLLIKLSALLAGGSASFSGWATALLFPTGLATAVFAWLCHGPMLKLEHKLAPEAHEELSWR